MMTEKITAEFDPGLCQSLDMLGIKRSCFYMYPTGKKKYYIPIKENIEKYRIKGSGKYKFPCYNIEWRAYSDYVIWERGEPTYLYLRSYRSPKVKIKVFLSWSPISL